MHLLDQRTLGVILVVLLATLVVIKKGSTGTLLTDRPKSGWALWLVHIFNMSFLLVVNPLVAILLAGGRLAEADPTRIDLAAPHLLLVLESAGLALYVAGHLLMAWALLSMGRGHQVGGSAPRPGDSLLRVGPYRRLRHPMYSAALCLSLGLALLTQSGACLLVFCAYVALILTLVPAEERGLRRAFGDSYARYQREVPRLVPFLY